MASRVRNVDGARDRGDRHDGDQQAQQHLRELVHAAI
jgi:hypothetical protein